MYTIKPCPPAEMMAPEMTLKVLVLNCSLKHEKEISNTGELSQLVVECMKACGKIDPEIIRISDKNIPVGLEYRESEDDDWPDIVAKIKAANIVIFATPIWWGGRSSLMQRVIERMDALDEEYHKEGRSALYNKVAGIVITGSEDGALSTIGTIMMVMTFLGFTFPPECAAYWIGEVGGDVSKDREKRLANKATKQMAMNVARNLVFYGQLLSMHPMKMKSEA
ncbi:MAG: NAD(P)H-dependent oxidoreductase [Ignavibacteria bacterium]